jgi:c-di-GMP-binding flagellar brake protein YcgR
MNGKQPIMKRFSEDSGPIPEREHERRAYPRHKVHKIVTYTYREKQLLTVTVDLGMGGMKIKTHYKLPIDESMNFKIVLGDNSISSEGRIVCSKMVSDTGRVSGIQFLRLSRRDSALLGAYLSGVEE